MTSTQQFDELKNRISQIANDVRGTVDDVAEIEGGG